MTSATYQVTGMTCEHCVRAVTEEIESLDGVAAVAVELVPGGASAVTVTSAAPLTAAAVAGALDEAGAYRLAPDTGTGTGNDAGAIAGGPRAAVPARALPLV
jgi:copper chaperone